ncbi:N5-glutamine methyltransferase family protein, partial [Chloroflexota bacterium]
DALRVAKTNCAGNDVADRVHLLCGNLLEPVPEAIDLIVANLPYVKNEDWEQLPGGIKANEPRSALVGGDDGLNVIKELLSSAKDKLRPGTAMLLEIGYDQGSAAMKLAKSSFSEANVELYTDMAGLDRIISIVT